jgi:RNA polymerase-binding transcription factor DksA
MKQFVAKIKGRGYWCGIRTKNIPTRKPEDVIEKELKQYQSSPSGRIPYWYDYNDYHKEPKNVCKRNLSDVPEMYIFNTKAEFRATLKEESTYRDNEFSEFMPDLIAEITLEEVDTDLKQKRVLNSKKKDHHVKSIMAISTEGASFCGNCGTNIYDDEPRMASPYTTICIHCLKTLGETITVEYEKVPEKYKADYLLARSVDI